MTFTPGYWERRRQEILDTVSPETISTERSAWNGSAAAVASASSLVTNIRSSILSTGVLGLASRSAFMAALDTIEDQLADRAASFEIGEGAADTATTASTGLRSAASTAPAVTTAEPGPLGPGEPDETPTDAFNREAEWSAQNQQHHDQIFARDEHFRVVVLAFEDGMGRAADQYALIDPRPRTGPWIPPPPRDGDVEFASTVTGRGATPSTSAVPFDPTVPRGEFGPVEVTPGDIGGGTPATPGAGTPGAAPGTPGVPGTEPVTPVTAGPGGAGGGAAGGSGLISGVGAAGAGVGAAIGLSRALRGVVGAAPATGRNAALTRGAVGRGGAVPPAQGRGAAGSRSAGARGGGAGVGRNGALGRGSGAGKPVSGSRGTRVAGAGGVTPSKANGAKGAGVKGTPASGAAGRGAAGRGAAGRGVGGGAGAAGRGGSAATGAGRGTGAGAGKNAASGSRGTRIAGGGTSNAPITGRRGGKRDEDEPKKRPVAIETDDWFEDDEPTGPSVIR